MAKIKVNCSICNSDLLRHAENPNTKLPIKNFFCNKLCKGQWQTNQRENLGFTKQWLENEYLTLGKGAPEIAKEIGRNSKRVWEWITDYGIPTRSRGYDTTHLPKDGSSFKGKRHSLETRKKQSEIAIEEGRVPYNPEVGSYMIGKKGKDHPNWKGGLTPDRQAVYASEEWSESVKAVWKRDKAICQRCGKNHNEEGNRGNFHIHHIISFMVKKLRTDVNNLVLLCKDCHKFVHSKNNLNNEFLG